MNLAVGVVLDVSFVVAAAVASSSSVVAEAFAVVDVVDIAVDSETVVGIAAVAADVASVDAAAAADAYSTGIVGKSWVGSHYKTETGTRPQLDCNRPEPVHC